METKEAIKKIEEAMELALKNDYSKDDNNFWLGSAMAYRKVLAMLKGESDNCL